MKFNHKIDIDLSDPVYRRRFGLEPNGDPEGYPFPYSIEEAAYFLVGLRLLQGFATDFEYHSVPSTDRRGDYIKIKDGKIRSRKLREFIRRDGLDVYHQLCMDLDAGILPSVTLSHLIPWIELRRQLLNKFPKDLEEQAHKALCAMSNNGKSHIPSRGMRKSIIESIENTSGYDFESLKWNGQDFVPKDASKGHKGKPEIRHRVASRHAARKWIAIPGNWGKDVPDFMKSRPYKEAVQNSKYHTDTVKGWLVGIDGFNRKPGRRKGSLNRI